MKYTHILLSATVLSLISGVAAGKKPRKEYTCQEAGAAELEKALGMHRTPPPPPEEPTPSYNGVWQALGFCAMAAVVYIVVTAIQDHDANELLQKHDKESTINRLNERNDRFKKLTEATAKLAALPRKGAR